MEKLKWEKSNVEGWTDGEGADWDRVSYKYFEHRNYWAVIGLTKKVIHLDPAEYDEKQVREYIQTMYNIRGQDDDS